MFSIFLLLLSAFKFHMLYETIGVHGCFQYYIIIWMDDFLRIGKPDSRMPYFSAEAFLLQPVQRHAIILKAIANDDWHTGLIPKDI